jgi:hypothetical protein
VLTRGYLVGEIIDELARLGDQVRMRNAVQLYDLTVVAENYFRDFLNILMEANFQNLNMERSNEPGIDLGDEAKKIGVQVTSTANSQKVNKTLTNLTSEQVARYGKFIVLGMNSRQSQYTIDSELAVKYEFDKDHDIWDLNTLARMTIDLPLDRLTLLYEFVRANSARLKVELEVPDEHGVYATSGYDMWETITKPKIGDGVGFAAYIMEIGNYEIDATEVKEALLELGTKLSKLPRMTREFLTMLCERREEGKGRYFTRDEWSYLLLSKVKRLYGGDDLKGELDILQHAGFVDVCCDESDPPEIGITIPVDQKDLRINFLDFAKEKKLSLRNIIGSVDLSAY